MMPMQHAKKRILFVEDDDSLRFGVTFALEREGWHVIAAVSLAAAREEMAAQGFDLLLLDNRLPDGRGLDFCREVRERSAVPIVFLTASDEEVSIVLGLESGADDYITKPFRVQELISRIRAVLRRMDMQLGMPSAGTMLWSEGIRVNLEDRTVTAEGRPVLVTPTEFQLLVLFLKHPLQVLTRQQVLQRLWDADGEYIDDNTLSVHIRRLREKIEPQPSQPKYIVTVRGAGYRWNVRREGQS
jgi:two-component system, OmpR family, response regulator RegX3